MTDNGGAYDEIVVPESEVIPIVVLLEHLRRDAVFLRGSVERSALASVDGALDAVDDIIRAIDTTLEPLR